MRQKHRTRHVDSVLFFITKAIMNYIEYTSKKQKNKIDDVQHGASTQSWVQTTFYINPIYAGRGRGGTYMPHPTIQINFLAEPHD